MSQQLTSDSWSLVPGTPTTLPTLEPGDHLDQKTFHARYLAMPEDFRAELIEGVVIVPSPIKSQHGFNTALLSTWLGVYQAATPNIRAFQNGTVLLGEFSEPQPDGGLIIESAGQTHIEDGYIVGPLELIAETAYSSQAYDLHSKYRDYERAGVREYVVVLLREREVRWFVLRDNRFQPFEPDAPGIFHSEVFPGLWLDSQALLRGDAAQLLATLQIGLQSPEHAQFVARLKPRS